MGDTFISILRGINVSGHKKILMTDLKTLYEQEGFQNILTYIQSGNVVFQTAGKIENSVLEKNIEQTLFNAYGFEVPVLVRSATAWRQILSDNPFVAKGSLDIAHLHVTFLQNTLTKAQKEFLESLSFIGEELILSEQEIYLYCPKGYGNTKLSNQYFEGKLKMKATTRNWKTVNAIARLL